MECGATAPLFFRSPNTNNNLKIFLLTTLVVTVILTTTIVTMAKKEQKVGRAELEILHFVQDHHPVSVRDVADHFAEARGHVRTTILNVMERLRKKGFLTRKKSGGIYQYEPRVGKAELLRSLVGDFVEKTLGGSLSPFVAYLSRDARLSDKELNDLKQAVSELKGKGEK